MGELKKLTDEEIVGLMQGGRLEVFSELVKRYEFKLTNYAMTLVRDEEAARDVVQDAFIKAYRKINSFDTKRKFSSWMYRIVHNQGIDYIRKHKKEEALQDREWLLNSLAEESRAEEELDKKMLKGKMETCMKALPVNYRSVLRLYYMEEKSYQEISDILRIPTGTVATRLNRGKTALAAICESEGALDYV